MITVSWVIFIAQLISSFMMIGIVWLQQLINFPLFTLVPKESFSVYHQAHLNRSQWLIAPLMLVEVLSAAFLLIWPIPQVSYYLYLINFLLIVLIWLETFLMQWPLQKKLRKEHSLVTIERLIKLNRLRAITWSCHGAVLIAILY